VMGSANSLSQYLSICAVSVKVVVTWGIYQAAFG
jgi:hypothetical protein